MADTDSKFFPEKWYYCTDLRSYPGNGNEPSQQIYRVLPVRDGFSVQACELGGVVDLMRICASRTEVGQGRTAHARIVVVRSSLSGRIGRHLRNHAGLMSDSPNRYALTFRLAFRKAWDVPQTLPTRSNSKIYKLYIQQIQTRRFLYEQIRLNET